MQKLCFTPSAGDAGVLEARGPGTGGTFTAKRGFGVHRQTGIWSEVKFLDGSLLEEGIHPESLMEWGLPLHDLNMVIN